METRTSRRATGVVALCVLAAAVAGPVVVATLAGPPAGVAAAASTGAAAAPTGAGVPAPSTSRPAALQSTPEADTTVTRVRLAPDASAVWTVTVRTHLANETDVVAFEEFRRRFEANRSRYLDPFRVRMTGVVAEAADATGRVMAARNFSATTGIQEVPRRWGVVTFRFRWDGFAETDGDALVVGDVFVGGLFLGERDSFVVAAPDGYRVTSADPEPTTPDTATVRWSGRIDFADGRPRVRVAPTGGTGDATDGFPLPLPVGAVVLAGLAGVAALAVRRRSGGPNSGGAAAVATDEERVEALLSRNGGRMRQADVADELGWSASKTSRVLSSMAEAGTVEKVRLGRENLVELVDAGRDAE